MDLVAKDERKRGVRLLVNGTVYQVGEDGCLRGVSDADAAKLLQNSAAWAVAGEVRPTAPAKRERMKLLTTDGTAIAPEPVQKNTPESEAPEPAATAPESATGVQSVPGPVPEPGESFDWPDPDEEMAIEYLQAMARAYEVPFNARTPKKTLVQRIHAAMYEEAT